MLSLKSGWFSVNHYILNDGHFNPNENWIIRGDKFGGRSTLGMSNMLSMAMRGNGHGFPHSHNHQKAGFLFINMLSDQDTLITHVYREISNYCELELGELTDVTGQRAYIDAKLAIVGFTLEIVTQPTVPTPEEYQALLDNFASQGTTIIATLFDQLPYSGESTANLQPLFDKGTDKIQLFTVNTDVEVTSDKLTGLTDVSINAGVLNLLTNKKGFTNTFVIPVVPVTSTTWERDTMNIALKENA